MIFENTTYPEIYRGLILAAIALFWILVLVRAIGLRSFSKMTSFDFVITVALGSLLAGATQVSEWSAFIQTITAITALMGFQVLLAFARQRSSTIESLLANKPVLLMEDGVINDAALAATRVSHSDVIAKLREANAINPDISKFVILESTGDISVLHGEAVNEDLLKGIRRY